MNYRKRAEIERNLDDDAPVREIEWFEPLDKGCLVYVEGEKEPMRGMNYWTEFVDSFIWKKGIVMFFSFLNGGEGFRKKGLLEKLFLIYAARKYYAFYIKFIHHALWDSLWEKADKYSQPVRELYRVFPESFEMERDIVCFFLEADHAYRYRWQDIMCELDKAKFKKNPCKEFQRLFQIMIDREPKTSLLMKRKWGYFKKMIPFAYWYLKIFKPSILKRLCWAIEDINIDEIKPSREDLYWMNRAESYNFRGLNWSIRKLMNLK